MTATARELTRSRDETATDHVRRYIITGATSSADALTALLAAAPSAYGTWPRTQPKVSAITDTMFEGEVNYSSLPDNETTEVGTQTESFEIAAQNQKITHAIDQIGFPSSGGAGVAAPNVYKGLGLKLEKSTYVPEGIDIFVPTYSFSITQIMAASSVDSSYKFSLFQLAAKVNSDAFGPFAAGEVLYLGARGSKRDATAWEISHSFLASPNVTGLSFGSVTGVDKKGWEYLEIISTPEEVSGGFAIISKVRWVYVSQVYKTASFAGLPEPT
jgi:hypothetical protein